MEFKEFAYKLRKVIDGASNTQKFTKTLFEAMMNDSCPELIRNIKPATFKSYFNGYTGISNIAAIVLANLSDDDEFPAYLEGFGDTATQLLTDEFIENNIFYTAITRARDKLKIYWTLEIEEKVIKRIKPRDISKNVEILKKHLTDEPNERTRRLRHENQL